MAPVIEGLSQHRVTTGELSRIYVNGTGFTGATGVQIGDQWGEDHVVDGDTVITVSIPELEPGAYWVVVHGSDGETSSCDGANQTLEILEADGGGTVPPKLTGITPEEIVVGEANTYWLAGEGLTGVTSVIIGGSHACEFQGYDDAQLKIDVPAEIGVTAGDDVKVEVLTPSGGSAELSVPTRGRPDDTVYGVTLLRVEPDTISADGGEFTLIGLGFGADVQVWLGDVECYGVDVVDEGTLRATAPNLSDQVGSTLTAFVISNGVQSVSTEAKVTVVSP